MRIALGLSYCGTSYEGWQSQVSGQTIQDYLEAALGNVAAAPVRVHCAGRTDAGVHALMQVAHFDTSAMRREQSWIRGCNNHLPRDIAVEWAKEVPEDFHCRSMAITRRYAYVLRQSAVRPSVELGRVGWTFRPLDLSLMRQAADILQGEHDFSAFRAAQCQALSPIKTLKPIGIFHHPSTSGAYWRFDFEANAFLHHMIRNLMGCLIQVGEGRQPVEWVAEVLASRSRKMAAPTFGAEGLYFLGPTYPEIWQLPKQTNGFEWLLAKT
jgi:tRNA pseudouridine38-40 synthase